MVKGNGERLYHLSEGEVDLLVDALRVAQEVYGKYGPGDEWGAARAEFCRSTAERMDAWLVGHTREDDLHNQEPEPTEEELAWRAADDSIARFGGI